MTASPESHPGLGWLASMPLAKARELAAECRAMLAAGRDPIAARREVSTGAPSFGAFADSFIETKGSGWRHAKYRGLWKMTRTRCHGSNNRGEP
jgi:hypothetical protein